MNSEQDKRESSMIVISLFTICVKREIREWKFPDFSWKFDEYLRDFTWNQ